MNNMDLRIFFMDSCNLFGEKLVNHIGEKYKNLKSSKKDERCFSDNEIYCCSLENVRGADCFVIQSCYSDEQESVNDKIMKMLIFIGSLKDASAGRITAVIPYFPYARQDRKTSSRAPITTKYIAKFFESISVDRILTMDAHNPTAIQNAFKINVDLLEANKLFAKQISHLMIENKISSNKVVIMSPDVGGLARARRFRSHLEKYIKNEIEIACMDKIHTDKEIRGNAIIGNVSNKHVILIDDMISSGKTIYECSVLAKSQNAFSVLAVCATHGLFVGDANQMLEDDFIKNIIITDTIIPFRIKNQKITNKLIVLETSFLFGDAINRIHTNKSISDLIENGNF